MKFKDIVMERFAVKKFNGQKIPGEKITEFFEMIRYAPSSFNIQPWKIKVVKDQRLKSKLQEAAWNQPQVTTSCHYLIFCADTELMKLCDQLEKLMLDNGVPKDKVESFLKMTRGFISKMSPEEQKSWAMRQVYLALGNAMNAAKALGFDSCPMEGIDPEKFKEILGLPDHYVVCCGLGIGFASDKQSNKLRFKTEEIFF